MASKTENMCMLLGHTGPRGGSGAALGLMKSHLTPRKIHKCSYCPFTTHCITNYKRHISAHTGDKPYAAITALTDLIQMI
ncbi:Zinc finger and BTB domain-containing protein 8B [Portunus trituberculatus]|uniref:Zinc finger and BTB domain-containing protein 8B n=1 Tax=Portunus trituberculatus TaxID=210409 RepID=A0A5B7EFQ5_PORTR|nr:Zinc finger and BTB domain-containing protein 8B [Portunus trituberculatus]